MSSESLESTRKLLTAALAFNSIAFFLPDLFGVDSHFTSTVWPIHSRVHVGAAAVINGVYILMGLYQIWRPPYDLAATMRWVATWLATWNTTFLLFAVLIVPTMLQPGDTWVHWELAAEGAGNDLHVAVEGLAFPMIGSPTLLFFWVLWRLRGERPGVEFK